MKLTTLFTVFASALLCSATAPTKTVKRTDSSKFVTTQGSQFSVNGSEFPFIGTNVYWLQALNTEQDIINTFSNISALGIKVVRTWAFNDVEVIPENGTWFQLIVNGTTTINNGTNGLQKLDMIVKHAENFGIYLMLTLTNNWAPLATDNLTNSISSLENSVLQGRSTVEVFNTTRPRNFLSNDYGGIDTYIRQFGSQTHDEFYTNQTLINAFTNYTTQIVSRYVESPAVFSWEVANDPRCNSSIAGSSTCTTQNITLWHQTIAQHIRSVDPNHLVSAGTQGFLCTDCEKLFPVPSSTPAPPQPSARAVRRSPLADPLSSASILKKRNEQWKKTRALLPKSEQDGLRIRGRWRSTTTRRQSDSQSQAVGSAFDGSQGVDSADILGIPDIGLGSFQFFPDQDTYGVNDPSLSAFNNTLQIGIDWINVQAQLAALYNKPVPLIAFGLLTQANAPFFVPFNTTIAPFASQSTNSNSSSSSPATSSSAPTSTTPAAPTSGSISGGTSDSNSSTQSVGVTNDQQATAYSTWLNTGISSGVSGLMQYQWSQSNLTTSQGSAITTTSTNSDTTGESSNNDTTGESPNDGYSIQGVGEDTIQGVLQSAVQSVGSD